MGTYGYYAIKSTTGKAMPLRAAATWLEQVAGTHGDGAPTLNVRRLSPAQAKALGIELSVMIMGTKKIDAAADHFAKSLALLTGSCEVTLGYTNMVARPTYEHSVAYVDDIITLHFKSSIFKRDLDRAEVKRAAEDFYRRTAKLLGVTLECEITLRPERQWPREEELTIRSIKGATATLDLGTTLQLTMPRARARFTKLLAAMNDLTHLDLVVRGPHAAATAESKRLAKGAKLALFVDGGSVPMSWAALAKLAAKPIAGTELSIDAPIKLGDLEAQLTLSLDGKKHELELSRKWGLSDEEQAALQRALAVRLVHTGDV